MTELVDLRTDTVTKPSAGMRQAMVDAVVGDEQKGEDPTVIALEQRCAGLLGQAAAVFVPSATMANQIALRLLTRPGDEVVAEASSHVVRSELAGHAIHSGLVIHPIATPDGRFSGEDVRRAFNPGHIPAARTTAVLVENTHSLAGGRVWSLAQVRDVVDAARELGLAAHLDGARLLNAAIASGASAAEHGAPFDTVTLCLSKGLGCPLGAVLAGSEQRIHEARRVKHAFGGALRQSGIVAAAGLYALDHHVEQLRADHVNARRLAAAWAARGVPVDPSAVESNFVLIDAGALGLSGLEATARLEAAGVLVSATARPDVLRAVTHRDLDDAGLERAIEAAEEALAPRGVG